MWGGIAALEEVPIPPEVGQLVAEFASVWQELNGVFDVARGRDLRELINGTIERQRNAICSASVS